MAGAPDWPSTSTSRLASVSDMRKKSRTCLAHVMTHSLDTNVSIIPSMLRSTSLFPCAHRNPGEDWICDLAPNEMDHLHDTVKYYILAPGMQYPKPEEGGRGGCVAGDISKAVTTLLVLSGSA
jgi:hypothetical protein